MMDEQINQQIIAQYYSIIKNKIDRMQFNSALASVDKLLTNFPNNEYGYYYKGVCEFALNRLVHSIRSYTNAIELNPAFAKAYFNLGSSHFSMQQYDLALINIAKALVLFTRLKEQDNRQRCLEAIKIIEKERG